MGISLAAFFAFRLPECCCFSQCKNHFRAQSGFFLVNNHLIVDFEFKFELREVF